MSYTIGVDLGTTWTAAAITDNRIEGSRPEAVMLTSRSMAMPSIVAVENGELVAGEAADRVLAVDPTLGAREFKRRLGDETPYIIDGTPLGAEALMAGVLRSTLSHPQIAAASAEGIERIVLTHPANWGDYKLDLVREIARLAGVEQLDLLSEPAAAAISYAAEGHLEIGQTVAVYDFGGGTFDVAIVKLESDGPKILGEPEGLERLGGIDLDQAVLQHVDHALDGVFAELNREDVEVRNALFRLRSECTIAKEALSGDTEVSIPVTLPGISTEVRLTRSEFEAAVGPRLDDTFNALDRAVASTGLTFTDLAGVLMVGGSSRLPMVGERLATHTGRPILLDADPKMVVALGAAGKDQYSKLVAAAAAAANTGGEPDDGAEADGADDEAAEVTHQTPAALAASIKVERPKAEAKNGDAARAKKARRRTAKTVAGGVAAAGAAAAAAGVTAAAVADAGPLAGIGPLDGDFDLGDALGDIADGTKSAFGLGGSDDPADEADSESGFDDGGDTAEATRFDQLRDLLSGDDELDEFDVPVGGGAAPSGGGGFGGGAAPASGQAFAPPSGAGSSAGFRQQPAQRSAPPSPPSAPPASAARQPQPPTERPSAPPERPAGQPQPGAERPSPAEPVVGRQQADAELDAVRAQLQERLDNWEQPDGVPTEDADKLREDLEGLLDRFQRDPTIPIDNAIADLKYEFEDRMRDFAQDQKIDALIEQQTKQEEERQNLETGVDDARALLQDRLAGWTPPAGADPAEAETLRAELAERLERFVPTPGQTVEDAIAELRADFNDQVGDFAQDLRIDALIDEATDPDSDELATDDDTATDDEAEAEEGGDATTDEEEDRKPKEPTAATDDGIDSGEDDDDELFDVFDEAEAGEHDVQLTKEIRLPDVTVEDEALYDDVVSLDIGTQPSGETPDPETAAAGAEPDGERPPTVETVEPAGSEQPAEDSEAVPIVDNDAQEAADDGGHDDGDAGSGEPASTEPPEASAPEQPIVGIGLDDITDDPAPAAVAPIEAEPIDMAPIEPEPMDLAPAEPEPIPVEL